MNTRMNKHDMKTVKTYHILSLRPHLARSPNHRKPDPARFGEYAVNNFPRWRMLILWFTSLDGAGVFLAPPALAALTAHRHRPHGVYCTI